MARRVERLNLDNLARLPGGCAACTFWEFDPVQRTRIRGHEAEEKAAWLSAMLRDWGSVGRVVLVEDRVVGHLLWAPALHLPGGEGFATAPVSSDAVLLASGYVDPDHRGQGIGRVLVQAMAKDLIKHGGVGAVEAFGGRRGVTDRHHPNRACVLPVDFLLAVGFKTHRPHVQHPRMRMDLRTTITWREEFETAVEKLLGVVGGKRHVPRPAHPSARGTSRRSTHPGTDPSG